MLDFHQYLMRYGEYGVQAIVENIERQEGISHNSPVSLEQRWEKIMHDYRAHEMYVAA